jgi:hypothetical protein
VSLEAQASQWVLDLLLSRRTPEVARDPATGRYVMGYSRTLRAIIASFLLLSAGVLILGVGSSLDAPGTLVIVGLVFGVMTLSMAWGAYDAFLVRVEFSEEGLFRSVLGETKAAIPWSAVTSVDYSTTWSWFQFRGQGFPTLRVSIYRDGLRTFADHAARWLERSPAGKAPYLLHQKAAQPGTLA